MKVGYFVPCYVDALAPEAAISTYKLLKRFDIDVQYIEKTACCGLPLYDMGYQKKACAMEKDVASIFAAFAYIVIPSGICTDQFRNLFATNALTEETKKVRNSIYDVVEFSH